MTRFLAAQSVMNLVLLGLLAGLPVFAEEMSPVSGDMIPDGTQPAQSHPVEQTPPLQPPVAQTPILLPQDVQLAPDRAVLDYLIRHEYFNPFPENLFHPQAPISRGEYVTLLYRASGLLTAFVSEFPYFRDVPTDYWAYFPIEAFRTRKILEGGSDGYFYPESAISRLDAAVMLSKTLSASWLTLTPEEVTQIFAAYKEPVDRIPELAQKDLARSIYAGFLVPTASSEDPNGIPHLQLALDAPLSRMDAARMVYERALLRAGADKPEIERRRWLPPGVELVVTPTSAISPEQLSVGQSLYFALTSLVHITAFNVDLPRDTRIHGSITEISADKMTALVALDRANLPSGEMYNLAAQLHLVFPEEKDGQVYLVPGEQFTVTTMAQP